MSCAGRLCDTWGPPSASRTNLGSRRRTAVARPRPRCETKDAGGPEPPGCPQTGRYLVMDQVSVTFPVGFSTCSYFNVWPSVAVKRPYAPPVPFIRQGAVHLVIELVAGTGGTPPLPSDTAMGLELGSGLGFRIRV